MMSLFVEISDIVIKGLLEVFFQFVVMEKNIV